MVKSLLVVLFLIIAAVSLVFTFVFLVRAQKAESERQETKAELEPLRKYIPVRDAEQAAKHMYAKARELMKERERKSQDAIDAAKKEQLAMLKDAERLQAVARQCAISLMVMAIDT